MPLYSDLIERSGGCCELCGQDYDLDVKLVPPHVSENAKDHIFCCDFCVEAMADPEANAEHWRCLMESAYTQEPAVQVTIFRLLTKLEKHSWAQHTLEQMYLDESTQEWANSANEKLMHVDSTGFPLQQGDSVLLIKDLDVKGANFVAKRGTLVKNIHLVLDNKDQIEGKVNDQRIVILCKFVRKVL